jgi:hypothetical protein
MEKYYRNNEQGGAKMKEIKIVGPNYPTSTDFEIVLELDDALSEEQIKKEIIHELDGLNIKIDENNIEKIGDSIYRVGLIVGEKGYNFKLDFDPNLSLDPELKESLYKAINFFIETHKTADFLKEIANQLKSLEGDYETDEEFI